MSFPNYYADYKTPRSVYPRKKIRRSAYAQNGELAALKTAVFNPFALTHPGIPDGKQWLSNKIKYQTVFEVNFRDDDSMLIHETPDPTTKINRFPTYVAKGTLDLLFFPGLNNMVLLQPREGSIHPLRYYYMDESGPTINNNGDQNFLDEGNRAPAPGDDTQGPTNAQTHALRLDTCIPCPFYAHDSFQTKNPVQPGTSYPGGQDLAEVPAPRLKYRQVTGFSEPIEQPNKANRIEKWRLVSCGLRVSCTNNATNNSGWWEAVRVNVAGNDKEWAMLPTPNGANAAFYPELRGTFAAPTNLANEAALAANYHASARYYIGGPVILSGQRFLSQNGNSVLKTTYTPADKALVTENEKTPKIKLPVVKELADLPNNNTYVSGKIRDMHKHIFKLRPSGDEHPYKEIPDTIRRGNYRDNWPYNDVRNAGPHGDEGSLVDDLFDAIHIRIHSTAGTNLLFHYVANQELVYDENSNFARTAEATSMAVPDNAIASVYNAGIPAAATTQPSSSRVLMSYPG